jgi:hypothetical protein
MRKLTPEERAAKHALAHTHDENCGHLVAAVISPVAEEVVAEPVVEEAVAEVTAKEASAESKPKKKSIPKY